MADDPQLSHKPTFGFKSRLFLVSSQSDKLFISERKTGNCQIQNAQLCCSINAHYIILRVPNYTQTIVQKYKCPVMATVLFCLKQTQDMSRFLKIITALQIPEYPLRFFKRIQQALYQIDYHKENRSSPGSSPESRPRSSSL